MPSLLCRSFLTARQALEQTLEKGVEQAAAEAGKPKAAQGQLPPAAPVLARLPAAVARRVP